MSQTGYSRTTWLALAVAMSVTACSRASEGPDIVAEDAWARPVVVSDTATGSWNSAVYVVLENRGQADDRLVAASTDAAVTVEIHESRVEDGVMRMRQVEAVALTAGERVALEPGGLHVMLMGVTRSLVAGDTIAVTLQFTSSDPLTIRVPVEQR
jgi:copper(I)-binding protein